MPRWRKSCNSKSRIAFRCDISWYISTACLAISTHSFYMQGNLNGGKSQMLGWLPQLHNYVPVILNFLSICRLARGAWILMLCSTPCTVYINLQKLQRVCVSRHRRLGDTINASKFLEDCSYGKALLCRLSCVAVLHWSPVVEVFIGAKHLVDWFLLKLGMRGINLWGAHILHGTISQQREESWLSYYLNLLWLCQVSHNRFKDWSFIQKVP